MPEVVDVLFGASIVAGEMKGKPDYPVILPSPLVDCSLQLGFQFLSRDFRHVGYESNEAQRGARILES